MSDRRDSRIRWGRIVTAAVLSELLVIALLLAVTTSYRFAFTPGRASAEYDAFTQSASYYIAPTAAGFATFFMAWWATRRLESDFLLNGVLVGFAAVLLTGGMFFFARPEHRVMYLVSFGLRIPGGYAGGLAGRMSTRPAAVAHAAGRGIS